MYRIRFIRGQRRELYPAGYRCVTRISRWGNPYKVADYGRAGAVQRYRELLERMTPDELRDYLAPLRGAACLACSCKPDELCHADVLIEDLEGVNLLTPVV